MIDFSLTKPYLIIYLIIIPFFEINILKTDLRNSDPEIASVLEELVEVYKQGPKFSNQLNLKAFEQYLKDVNKPDINLNYIKDGFPLYLKESELPTNLSTHISNWAKNRKDIIKILKQFIKECKNGAIIPTKQSPKYNINVFTVPKKDSTTGEYTKLRVVRHGSFHTNTTTSINQWIQPEKCKMPTLPNLKDYVRVLIEQNWISLRDLSDAFRQIGLAKQDVGFLGYSIFGLKFFDMKQPYGIASAAANCQSFAQHLIWILENYKLPENLRNIILVHIDDFSLPGKTKEEALLLMKAFDNLCKELNVKVSTDKNVDVTQIAELYGFIWNLKKKTVGIPKKKREELKNMIKLVIKYEIISGRALEALCGKIMHWSQLYKPAKPLCYNMLGFIFKNIRHDKKLKLKWFKLPKIIIKDLHFWLKYLDLIEEVDMIRIIQTPSIQIMGSSDASNFGAGFCIGSAWSFYKFTNAHKKSLHINQKEAHVVLTAIETLKHQLTGRRLILMVDNTSVFYAMCKRWAKPRLMPFVYEVSLKMMEYKIDIWFEWIPTQCNVLADTLSRFKLQEFWQWVNLHNFKIDSKKTHSKYIRKLSLNSNIL